MLKRAISYIWKTERGSASRTMEHEYEKWSKQQLIDKIKELERSEDSPSTLQTTQNNETQKTKEQDVTQKKKKPKQFDFSKHPKRFIALKFAYLGWNYNGLNFQNEPTPLPTVEEEILKAMATAKLVLEADPAACNFSRCGRTDKGVSAMNQVISLDVRSNLSAEDQSSIENDNKEIPYVTILNSLLPTDIRITAICLRPPTGFDARFSCKYRHYKYLFKNDDLDLKLMQEAANKYEGVHDFRNFCKIDGSKQITNYFREVYSANIIHLKDDYYVFDLKGSAFLWHQVRCMIAVLFLVGQKLEKPTLVDDLMNVEKYPSRPNYMMAHDLPLVLYDCIFPEMEWIVESNTKKLTREYAKMNGLALDYQVKAHMVEMMEGFFIKQKLEPIEGVGSINAGDGVGRAFKNYVPVLERQFGATFEEVNERHRQKKKRKLEEDAESK